MKTFKTCLLALAATLSWATASAQQLQFSQPHGFYDQSFSLQITSDSILPEGTTIRYTLDGSEPTTKSTAYGKALTVKGTTILRAAILADTGRVSPIATATYLFTDDILKQSNQPKGYPDTWGRYTQISGTAIADYEMDPEMTNDPTLRPKIAEGLKSLPALSIVTDKDNLFNHENDPDRGGIYIFTGPPVGDATGHGWTRPASVELIDVTHPDAEGDAGFSTTCGLRLHGGHGRLAEKNPKHSFRLVFKEKYGPKTLKYPLFGEDQPSKFDQLVLRCHFGNAWQHWGESNRTKAQYTRDVWTRRIQRKMGHTAVNALYVNLFINGMYWGLYNLAERVDDQFGHDHLGGKKADIDVIKIEEDGGNHIEAAEGDLEAWQQLVNTVAAVAGSPGDDDTAYNRLQGLAPDGTPDSDLEPLLDIDNFIDYMLINQYGGNTDWDHHNWYALRRKGPESQGFRFLCWDSEIIFESVNENVLGTNNRGGFPTGMFHNLVKNDRFARRYLKRAKELLSEDGYLGQGTVVEVWDSLYNTIAKAIYAEAARWGDYRRDVHPWQSRGQLYTVDDHYLAERNRLLTQYFPYRTDRVLSQIESWLNIDDWEAPADWEKLTASMFHEWNGTGADAQPLDKQVGVSWQMGVDVGGGGAIAGFVGVEENHFADLSQYDKMVMRGEGSGLRILANRLVSHGPWKQIIVSFNDSDPYWDAGMGVLVFPLDDLRTVPTNEGVERIDDFVHLNALKVDWSSTVRMKGIYLIPRQDLSRVDAITTVRPADNRYYTLSGQLVQHPAKGIYIHHGHKVVVK